ncbi:FixH family protein [Flocculibacter collagenilyticus]|uniref:FixH family protein n=1 Tax=Flocculibacter collagenilyticus TaxID=2744479 RepID=UPI0018F67C47|nr:FixH family protein [Flocculibacter collagenilyticus]
MNKSPIWYKQFWPWFIIILPLTAVVAGIITLFIALDKSPEMVVDEYYKKGKAINLDLSKYHQAEKMGISMALAISDSELAVNFTKVPRQPISALKVAFYHPTLANKDFSLLLTSDAHGTYRHQLEQPITGAWDVTLSPHDDVWKLRQRVALPRKDTIVFEPK